MIVLAAPDAGDFHLQFDAGRRRAGRRSVHGQPRRARRQPAACGRLSTPASPAVRGAHRRSPARRRTACCWICRRSPEARGRCRRSTTRRSSPPAPHVLGVVQQADKDCWPATPWLVSKASSNWCRLPFRPDGSSPCCSAKRSPQQASRIASRPATSRTSWSTATRSSASRSNRVAVWRSSALRDPIGPFVPRQLTAMNVVDGHGRAMTPQTVPIETTVTDDASVVSGQVLDADGTPVPFASVRLLILESLQRAGRHQLEVGRRAGAFQLGLGAELGAQPDRGGDAGQRRGPRGRLHEPAQRSAPQRQRRLPRPRHAQGPDDRRGRHAAGEHDDQGHQPHRQQLLRHHLGRDRAVHDCARAGRQRLHRSGQRRGEREGQRQRAHPAVRRDRDAQPDAVQPDRAEDHRQVRQRNRTRAARRRQFAGAGRAGRRVLPERLSARRASVRPASASAPIGVARTDAAGRFELAHISAGQIRLATFDQLTFQQGEARVTLPADGAVDANLLLAQGLGTVNGTVVDRGGTPVAGARVGGGLSLDDDRRQRTLRADRRAGRSSRHRRGQRSARDQGHGDGRHRAGRSDRQRHRRAGGGRHHRRHGVRVGRRDAGAEQQGLPVLLRSATPRARGFKSSRR